jgi:hypothetical protein
MFLPIFSDYLFSRYQVPRCISTPIFLRLATVAASVTTNFKIFKMCTFNKDKHYFWKLVAKEMKWVNENMGP